MTVDGPKSTSEVLLVLSFAGAVGDEGTLENKGRVGDELLDVDKVEVISDMEMDDFLVGDAACPAFKRASRRAFNFNARCTSCRILGSTRRSRDTQ